MDTMSTEFYIAFGFTFFSALAGVWWRLQVQLTAHMRELDAFKLKAAESYVPLGSVVRLEVRLEEGFKGIREEMREQNALILKALSNNHRVE